jgi:hypothetical protein
MLAFNRLRIDPGDGCPAVEYRIEDDHVDSRVLDSAAERSGAIGLKHGGNGSHLSNSAPT